MKNILFVISVLISSVVFGQSKGYWRYDTIQLEKIGGNSEINILNGTRNVTNGVLTNVGNGRTRFVLPTSPTVTGANQGVSLVGTNVQLGQLVGAVGDPALMTTDREIPLSTGKKLMIKDATGGTITFLPQLGAMGLYSPLYAALGFNVNPNVGIGERAYGGISWNRGTATTSLWPLVELLIDRGPTTNHLAFDFRNEIDALLIEVAGANGLGEVVGVRHAFGVQGGVALAAMGSNPYVLIGGIENGITYQRKGKLEVRGSSYFTDTVRIATMLTGSGTDSVLVIKDGIIKRVLQSSIGGGGSSTWNGITNPTGDQALTFDAGESSTWTNSNTTEDLFTVNSSTITSSSYFSLNSTSTALAAGNNLAELIMSGANGTSAITANPLRVSVTNTNATSGTNIAIDATASGATTANYSLKGTGAVWIRDNSSVAISAFGVVNNQLEVANNGHAFVRIYSSTGSHWSGLDYNYAPFSHFYNIAEASTNEFLFSDGALVRLARLANTGKWSFGYTAPVPSAWVTTAAGTTTIAPYKETAGVLLTTIQALTHESNASGGYRSTVALNRYAEGGVIADFVADANNGTTVETDLFTYTTKASTLAATGEKILFELSGTFNDLTATSQLQFYFGGTNIGNSGALTVSALGGWYAKIFVIRTGASTARAVVTLSTPGASTATYTTETDITGLTFTNTNIIKVTGTAAGASGGSSDITAKLGTILWFGAANN